MEHKRAWNTVFQLWDHVDSDIVPYSCKLDGDPGGNEMLIQEVPIAHMRVGLRAEFELIEKARHIHAQRRLRDEVLGNELFGDPGWDLMLDLYIAQASGKRVSVTSAAIGSGKPMSTGLRWVKLLIERALVIREADPYDGRRSYLRLTSTAFEAMEDFLARC
ncbi:MAG: Transcriptional regulator [Sphingomonas bacterium]|nr:Transcriptional regulator [Sphingomonas bacterium]